MALASPCGVGVDALLGVCGVSHLDVQSVAVVDERQGAGGGLVGIRHIDGRFLGAVDTVLGAGLLDARLYLFALILGPDTDGVEDTDQVGGIRFVPKQFVRSIHRAEVVLFEVFDHALLAFEGFMHWGHQSFLPVVGCIGARSVPWSGRRRGS